MLSKLCYRRRLYKSSVIHYFRLNPEIGSLLCCFFYFYDYYLYTGIEMRQRAICLCWIISGAGMTQISPHPQSMPVIHSHFSRANTQSTDVSINTIKGGKNKKKKRASSCDGAPLVGKVLPVSIANAMPVGFSRLNVKRNRNDVTESGVDALRKASGRVWLEKGRG